MATRSGGLKEGGCWVEFRGKLPQNLGTLMPGRRAEAVDLGEPVQRLVQLPGVDAMAGQGGVDGCGLIWRQGFGRTLQATGCFAVVGRAPATPCEIRWATGWGAVRCGLEIGLKCDRGFVLDVADLAGGVELADRI